MFTQFDRRCRCISVSRYFKLILIALRKNPNCVFGKCVSDYLFSKTNAFFLFPYSIRQILFLKIAERQ